MQRKHQTMNVTARRGFLRLIISLMISPTLGLAAETGTHAPRDSSERNGNNEGNAAANGLARIKQRVYDSAQKTAVPPEATLRNWLRDLTPTGTWPDIDYHFTKNGGWQPGQHLDRILFLGAAFVTPGSGMTDDAAAREALPRAFGAWFSVLPGTTPRSVNWWHNDIGAPLKIAAILLLLEPILTAEAKSAGLAVLAHSWAPTNTSGINTGANLVWRARITVTRACLAGDAALMTQVSRRLADELVITDGEGLQPDSSFWQHGPQLQTLSYGVQLSDDLSEIALLFQGTEYAFSDPVLRNLLRLLLDGQQWAMRGPIGDFTVRGRGLAIPGNWAADLRLIGTCDRLLILTVARNDEVEAFRDRLKNSAVARPLIGNRAYWRSGYMTHHRSGYFASVRVTSRFLRGMEVINGAGLRSRYLGDGVMCLYRTGQEYTDIFPVWDWQRLPGVTCAQKAEVPVQQGGYARGGGEFAGNVSDGKYGATAYDYDKDGVRARKAWFFFDREFVCLGAGITADGPDPVATSVNQCLLRNAITTSGTGTTTGAAQQAIAAPGWVHHDEVGYLFPQKETRVVLKTGPQTGSWHDINSDSPPVPVTKEVFRLWLDHGVQPDKTSYGYIVAPGITAGEMPAYAAEPGVTILANTPSLQAVYHAGLKMTQAVFYAPGSVTIRPDFILSVSHACALLLREDSADKVTLTVADPGNPPSRDYDETVQQFKPVANPAVVPVTITATLSTKRGQTQARISTPVGMFAGQSVTKRLRLKV